MQQPVHSIVELSNGIRVVYHPSAGTDISHCCVSINSGSRDEPEDKNGLAHFVEHLLFKGTAKRKSYQILNRLEVLGGELNAYTTKEQMSLHASVLDENLDTALDLLADIALQSIFPEQEVEKEKGVIIDEIDSYRESPEEMIYDESDELLFAGHTLSRPILGTEQTVSSFQKKDLQDYVNQQFTARGTVIGVHSALPLKKIIALAEKCFGHFQLRQEGKKRTAPPAYKAQESSSNKSNYQAHVLMSNRAYSITHDLKVPMLLLNNLLGGPGMSSRLNLNIREKHGIAYTIDSGYSPLTDTGIFNIYIGTDPEKLDKCLKLVHKELQLVREKALSPIQLQQAKKRFTGQIALAEESRMAVILSMAKSLLDYDRIDTLSEVYRKINEVTSEQLLQAANEIFEPKQLSTLVYLPKE